MWWITRFWILVLVSLNFLCPKLLVGGKVADLEREVSVQLWAPSFQITTCWTFNFCSQLPKHLRKKGEGRGGASRLSQPRLIKRETAFVRQHRKPRIVRKFDTFPLTKNHATKQLDEGRKEGRKEEVVIQKKLRIYSCLLRVDDERGERTVGFTWPGWGVDHTGGQFWHHPSAFLVGTVWKMVGQHLFMHVVPVNVTAGTGRKVWCDRGMGLRNNQLKFTTSWKSPVGLEESKKCNLI